jgi:hypothetical protein
MQHTLSALPPPRRHSVQQCSTHDAKVDDIFVSEQAPECLHDRLAQVRFLVHDAIRNAAIRGKFTKAPRRNRRGRDIGVRKIKVIPDPPAHHFPLLACACTGSDRKPTSYTPRSEDSQYALAMEEMSFPAAAC